MKKVLHDKVWIKPDEPEKKTKGGIIIPSSAQRKQKKGVVMAKGDKAADVQVGDKVFFDETSAYYYDLNGVNCAIVRRHEVQLIL